MSLQRIARSFGKRFGSSWWLRPGPRKAYRKYPRLALESLEDRTLLDASLNQLFVQRAYSELLGREPESAGEQGWVSLSRARRTQQQVVIGIENSQEYWSRQVRLSYENILHREPEEAGYLGWAAIGNWWAVSVSCKRTFWVRSSMSRMPAARTTAFWMIFITMFLAATPMTPGDPAGVDRSARRPHAV